MTSPAWPGYQPWAGTVAAARAEFERTARAFGLLPRLIPPVDREDVALLYCFCRQLDDAVDDTPDPSSARAALDAVEAECQDRRPPRPLIAAFRAGAARSGLPIECTRFLLDGLRGDLDPVRIGDDTELIRYCYRVSAAVGLMLAPLLGIRDPAALVRAVDLGIALQLSNILLGVRADAGRNRVYLPATRLARHGLGSAAVLAGADHATLRPVLQELAELADIYYRSAEAAAWCTPLRYRHGILLLGRVYGGMGREAARRPEAPTSPTELRMGTRLWRLIELAALAVQPRILGIGPASPHDPALHTAIAGWPGADPTAG